MKHAKTLSLLPALLLVLLALPLFVHAEEASFEYADFTAKFPDKFCAPGESWSMTDTEYKSESINITVTSARADKTTYYVADIYIASSYNLRMHFSKNKWNSTSMSVADMAEEAGAVLAMTGDSANRLSKGIVILDNQLIRKTKSTHDYMFVYYDGSVQMFLAGKVDAAEEMKKGVLFSCEFGPSLLDDAGEPIARKKLNTGVFPANPRAAFGYYEPGHYCFVLVDGRNTVNDDKTKNAGMDMSELAQLMKDLGCTSAYNLDGGQSAVLWFNQQVVNNAYKGGRNLETILYIGE